MLFENLVVEEYEFGKDYAFDFQGIGCQVNQYREDENNYETQLYYGDKYIRWGRVNGEMFSQGDDIPFRANKDFFEAFSDYFGYAFPVVHTI